MEDATTALTTLTEALIDTIDAFQQLLEAEAQALASVPVSVSAAELGQLVERKLAHAEQLDVLERALREQLAQMGVTDVSRETVIMMLRTLPDGDSLAGRWQRAMTGLEHCLQLNTAAGSVVRLQAQRTQRSLEILTGADAQSLTYGPEGLQNASRRHQLAKA